MTSKQRTIIRITMVMLGATLLIVAQVVYQRDVFDSHLNQLRLNEFPAHIERAFPISSFGNLPDEAPALSNIRRRIGLFNKHYWSELDQSGLVLHFAIITAGPVKFAPPTSKRHIREMAIFVHGDREIQFQIVVVEPQLYTPIGLTLTTGM
jgi:hypothetical protein